MSAAAAECHAEAPAVGDMCWPVMLRVDRAGRATSMAMMMLLLLVAVLMVVVGDTVVHCVWLIDQLRVRRTGRRAAAARSVAAARCDRGTVTRSTGTGSASVARACGAAHLLPRRTMVQ